MNSATTDSTFPATSSNPSAGLNGNGTVHRVAQKAHEAVDKIEQTLGTSSEKVMSLQEEYGHACREQVKAHPLTAIAGAFAAGVVFSKLFMR